MSTIGQISEQLEKKREATLALIGEVSEHVLSRAVPGMIESSLCSWPANILGKQKVVRRAHSILVVTDGISNPWDSSIHDDVPDWTFGFELAIETPLASLEDQTEAGISRSWLPQLLWAVSDWVVEERHDLKGRLLQFGCSTLAAPPVTGLEKLVATNGFIGLLAGLPYVGDELESQAALAPEPGDPEDRIWLLPLKLLSSDEYDWVLGDKDGARAKKLAKSFLGSSRHLSWPARPSASIVSEI